MQSKSLWIFLAISLTVTLLVPLYTIHYQYPAFAKLLKDNVTNDATRLASHLSSILVAENDALSRNTIPDALRRQIESLKDDSRFQKIRIFSLSGEILYSTQQSELGMINGAGYFRRIVETGRPLSVEVAKDAESLERQVLPADAVETYVPMRKAGSMVGVLEVYYDITEENNKLHALINRSMSTLFALMLVLVILVVISTVRTKRSIEQRRGVEKEREDLILQLQDALASVKTLKGLLPMCAWCRKIRDDDGYFKSIEEYFENHLDAKFTHGICQECQAALRAEIARVHANPGLSKRPEIEPEME